MKRSKSKIADKIWNKLKIKYLKKRCFRKNDIGGIVNYMDYGLDMDELNALFPPTINDIENIRKEFIKYFN